MSPVRRTQRHAPREGAGHPEVSRVIEARRRLETLPQGGGRAWINGREIGGPSARFKHLGQMHD